MKQPFQLKPLVIALAFSGASLPIHVFAEETQNTSANTESDVITLADVVVTGANKKQTVVPKRKVTSIYGTDSSVLDTPRVVSQVSEQQFREDVIRSADDLVKYAPSITRGGDKMPISHRRYGGKIQKSFKIANEFIVPVIRPI
jgi:outer membrane receptor for monomeric catechols